MTKQEALKIAKQLDSAHKEGLISADNARKIFRKVALQYKLRDKMKEFHADNPKLVFSMLSNLDRR